MDNSIQKILLVDDNKATNFYNKQVLKKSAYRGSIAIALNGLEALDHIKTSGIPDIIFLDINMPIMCGLSFLTKVQPILSSSNTLIIVMMEVLHNKEVLDMINSFENVKILRQKMLTNEIINHAISNFKNQTISSTLR